MYTNQTHEHPPHQEVILEKRLGPSVILADDPGQGPVKELHRMATGGSSGPRIGMVISARIMSQE